MAEKYSIRCPNRCVERINNGWEFEHYTEEGAKRFCSTIDDFGFYVCKNDKGDEIKVLGHEFLGATESGGHLYKDIPKGYVMGNFVKDNAQIDNIKSFLAKERIVATTANPFCCNDPIEANLTATLNLFKNDG